MIAGTPPSIEPESSQTAVLPSPSGRETSIWRSGNTVGSLGFQLNALFPTAAPVPPGLPSSTNEKPCPADRSNICVPSGSVPVDATNVSSARVTPKNVTTGSGGTVAVGVEVIVGVGVIVGVAVAVGVLVGVRVLVSVAVDVGVSVGLGVRVAVGVLVAVAVKDRVGVTLGVNV